MHAMLPRASSSPSPAPPPAAMAAPLTAAPPPLQPAAPCLQPVPPEPKRNKPGRKRMEDVPATKRAAQNRASQRAYRQRQQAHLQHLETQVKTYESQFALLRGHIDSLIAENGRLKQDNAALRTRSSQPLLASPSATREHMPQPPPSTSGPSPTEDLRPDPAPHSPRRSSPSPAPPRSGAAPSESLSASLLPSDLPLAALEGVPLPPMGLPLPPSALPSLAWIKHDPPSSPRQRESSTSSSEGTGIALANSLGAVHLPGLASLSLVAPTASMFPAVPPPWTNPLRDGAPDMPFAGSPGLEMSSRAPSESGYDTSGPGPGESSGASAAGDRYKVPKLKEERGETCPLCGVSSLWGPCTCAGEDLFDFGSLGEDEERRSIGLPRPAPLEAPKEESHCLKEEFEKDQAQAEDQDQNQEVPEANSASKKMEIGCPDPPEEAPQPPEGPTPLDTPPSDERSSHKHVLEDGAAPESDDPPKRACLPSSPARSLIQSAA